MTIGRILLTAALAGALCAGGLGCGGGDDEGEGGGAGASGAKKGAASTPEAAQRKEIEGAIETTKNALVKTPLELESTIGTCERTAQEARDAGFKDLVAKCEQLEKDAKATFDTAAEKELADAIATSKKYVADGDLKKAKNRLEGLPKSMRKDDRYWVPAQAALADLKKAERAQTYYTSVTKTKVDEAKSSGEWEHAQGLLEAFLAIPAFAASPRAKDVEAALAEVKPEVEKARAARKADSAVLPLPAFKGSEKDLFKWELNDNAMNCTVDSNGILTFKYLDGEEKTSSIRFGENEWQDYNLDIAFRLEKGSGHVNIHGWIDGETSQMNWQPGVKIDSSDTPDGSRWYKLHAEVRGKDVKFVPPGSSGMTKSLKSEKGPFEIRLDKGAVIKIKSVWLKILK